MLSRNLLRHCYLFAKEAKGSAWRYNIPVHRSKFLVGRAKGWLPVLAAAARRRQSFSYEPSKGKLLSNVKRFRRPKLQENLYLILAMATAYTLYRDFYNFESHFH